MRLELHQVEVRAGSFRLGPLTLAVQTGEYLIVLGPTGAGKTVTLEAAAGLRHVSAGRILMDAREVTHAPPESRRIGFLYQDSLLFPHLTVRANLAYGAHRSPRAERAAAVERLARLLQVEPLLARMPRGLSGGERQRVALGRALASNPVLLLLDEPMAALDPNTRHALRQTLLELHRELGTTTIHVTHNFSEALALGDRVAILIGGKLLQAGPPQDVFSRPDSTLVAHFLRSATLAAGQEPPDPGDSALTIYPRDLSLRVTSDDHAGEAPTLWAGATELATMALSGGNGGEAVAGRVLAVESDGAGSLRLAINVGLELRAVVATAQPGAASLVAGQSVWVRLPRNEARNGK
ncbi:MAG: ABC transporter ATP-binding protein [Candidatus Binataceae bacterium]